MIRMGEQLEPDPMGDPTVSDHTLALLRRVDAKLDRLQADVTDLRGRLQRVEGRLTSLDARLGVIEGFDRELTRVDHRLDEQGRRLARVEDATVLAQP
jgi:hypothetical protein